MAAIETEGLTRLFGDRRAVDGVSMTVPDHSVYGVLGRNGAGKTTTMKMLTGLLRPSSGVARVCGVDVVKDRRGAARKIGALLEAHGFYGHLSGRENLDLTRRLLGLATTEVDRVLDVVDMTRDGGRRVGDYSLGMRQRLGIARALLGSPPVLMLDEPTNGLDPDGIADMRHFLRELPIRAGATVLLSSHLLGEIEQTATHVGVIHQGRLVVEGEMARLKAELAPEIGLRVDDPARARAVLRSRDLTLSDDADGLVARLRPGDDHDQVCAALNRDLVAAGVAVFSIGARARSLESVYRAASAVSPTPVSEPV
ncbi:ABC transporter ATP-binding protein [Brevundimonas sp.]|uniref:ABC transporter ATP-binding protein n=1 Tax=Brevundimonas sp. TaxID=1871086 RepID=UPI00257DAAD9|nr:ABC transporter ATP-binding protein [Brevundimonas sp.]